jgi:hypothetical protein
MNVFVRRSSLAQSNADTPVMGFYEDHVSITPEMRRPEFVLLSLPPNAVVSKGLGTHVLAPGWREAYREQVAKGEAERRIAEVFPEQEQISAAMELAMLAAQHQAGQWPREAQKRREEIERAWAYVRAVRQAAKAPGAVQGDPTADNRWPARAAAYKA